MKIIIKNCPALRFKLIPLRENPICSKIPFEECCKDITDCVMKRIVELCKGNIDRIYQIDGNVKVNGLIEIDGCNVAECCNLIKSDLKKPICKNGGLRGGNRSHLCEDNNDCYFRQLQRAKAELEQYKKSKQASYETMQTEWNNAVNELRDLKASDKIEFKQFYKAENERLQAENERLKKRLENKEKAYNHLCNANSRKKEQIKNLNYMLFEEKEMTTQEWKLKYRLAKKERKFIQYKEITNKRLNDYKQVLEEIRELGEKTGSMKLIEIVDEVLND